MSKNTSNRFRPTVSQKLALWAYTVLIALAIPFLIIHTVLKRIGRAEGYTKKKCERFGLVGNGFRANGLWIHCVSVGEVVAASALIEKLLIDKPSQTMTVTTTTYTGAQRALDLFGSRVQHCYLPYDFPFFIANALNKINPSKILITEVELWPNLIHQCWTRNIPTMVINARMTDKSCINYQKVSLLFSPMLHKLQYVCAQGKRDFDNYLKLGIPTHKLTLTNNMKFDIGSKAPAFSEHDLTRKYNPQNKLIFLAGSTHESEEKIILDAFEDTLTDCPQLMLIIVPRHPKRFDTVYTLCQERNLVSCRASSQINRDINVMLVDEMGVLSSLYQLAEFAFIGGSIAPRGGHNALEAAIHAVPVVMGSSRYNNPEICQALSDAGALQTADTAFDMRQIITNWLSCPEQAKIEGKKGQQIIKDNAGAVNKTLRLIT